MSSTLLMCFSCSHGTREHRLPKSICHSKPGTKSPPPPVPSLELLVGFGAVFPRGGTTHGCPCSLALLCHCPFPSSSGFAWVYPSSFEALWSDCGNDSHSPLQGKDTERLTSQAWLEPRQQKVSLLGVLCIPCLGAVPTRCSLSPQAWWSPLFLPPPASFLGSTSW